MSNFNEHKPEEKSWDLLIAPGYARKNYLKDLWRYRELLYILSWRDIKVRYKQTYIGAAWSIIRPLLTTVIFTLVFGKMAGLKSGGAVPYVLMVYCGMLPWQFFSNALTESSGSLIGNSNLITKVYFPRLIIPVSSLITSLVDFAFALVILVLMLFWFRFIPPWQILFLPLIVLLTFACSLGTGLFLTAANVKYRDFRYIIPFIVQFGLYVSPVGFSSHVISEKYRLFYSINPMTGIIDAFRWCILGDELDIRSLGISASVALFLMIIGFNYFRKMERSFADNI